MRGTRKSGIPVVARNLLLSVASVMLFLSLSELLLMLAGWDAGPARNFKFIVRQDHGDLEIPFNVADARLMWRPKPGFDAGIVHINPDGYRDYRYPREKPAGTVRSCVSATRAPSV